MNLKTVVLYTTVDKLFDSVVVLCDKDSITVGQDVTGNAIEIGVMFEGSKLSKYVEQREAFTITSYAINGVTNGPVIVYQDGALFSKGMFKNGKLHGGCDYYIDDKIVSRSEFKNGARVSHKELAQ